MTANKKAALPVQAGTLGNTASNTQVILNAKSAAPKAPAAFLPYRQFIVHNADKQPLSPVTFTPSDAHDPANHLDFQTALSHGQGVGFVITDRDPFFFLDIDHAWDGAKWSDLAATLCAQFAGCYVEVSQSGTGLHIFGTCHNPPPHACKNVALGLELYTTGRYAALTGTGATGDAGHVADLTEFINQYFPPTAQQTDTTDEWTTAPRAEWNGLADDQELIAAMLKSRSTAAMFGGRASLTELWNADPVALARVFPTQRDGQDFDHSSADQALCNHLAWWTGRDCERMDRVFRMSGLYRDKWDREDYRMTTILKAVRQCIGAHGAKRETETPSATLEPGGATLEPGGVCRLTELGNAERFRDQHGNDVRYVPAWKKWIHYDGRRWKVGADDQIRRLAHDTVKGIYAEAAAAGDNDTALRVAKWAAQSCKSNSITALLREAGALLAIDPVILDADPWLLNCENYTLDLQHGPSFRPHRREDWITKIVPIEFDPTAKAPTFEKTLQTCFAGNQSLIDFLQRFIGYSATGSTREQAFAIWWGGGANGKSTILNAISEALGDYAQTTRPETFMAKNGDGIPSDLAKLKGARLVTASESEDGQRLAESQIKQITGGELIQARALYQDWFEYRPQFKLVLCTNHRPVIRGDDHAIWRRIMLVPFTVTIPPGEQDKDLADKLRAELPGIFTWITHGAGDWVQRGLDTPEAVRAATAGYQSESNVIGNFIESVCTVQQGAEVEAGALFSEFDRWRMREGLRKITLTKFGRMLPQLGFEKARGVAGRTIYRGIGLPTLQPFGNAH